MGNDVCMWEMASVFEKRLKYVGSDIDLWQMATICGKRLKNLINGLIHRETT